MNISAVFTYSIFILALLFQACTPQWLFQPKDLPYEGVKKIVKNEYEHILGPDDKITISVWGHDELGVGSSFSVYSSTLEQGKYITIDTQGEITLPLIGKVEIQGLTAREADLYIRQLYAKYVKNPIVYLRVLSHTVTMLGEVNTPGNYFIDKQNKSLIEIIADAGGFTNYADKTQIRIIRQDIQGNITEIPIDLTDIETLYRSDLSLRSKDVIYIPEKRSKQFEQVVTGKIVPVVGVIGSVALLLSLVNRNP